MTKRDLYLEALRNRPSDQIVWAPNFDYWLAVNTAEGSLPKRFAGMSGNDIVRAIGGTIWRRAGGLRTIIDSSVKVRSYEIDAATIHEYETPIGTVRSVYCATEGPHRTKACTEHFVKDLESLRIMHYVAEATRYELDREPVETALREVGDDGVVLHMALCVPFIQFAKTDAGYVNGIYLWADHRKEVDKLIQTYHRKFIEGYRILAQGPADIISTGDNMDGVTMSPALFKEYAIPFYREAGDVIRGAGKLFAGHWCGRTENLLHLVPGCGLDVVEAIVTKPMAKIQLNDALERLQGQVVLQGGIPSVLVCKEGCARKDFERYIRETILPLKGRKGFVLGMADNVPPNADFARVEAVARLLAESG